MSTEPTSSSSSTTINRGKSRLGLLLKQYYDDPALDIGGDTSGSDLYALPKLEKLRTDPLMSRAVESLRSYKEAESELRLLLYKNCNKLVEAVQVVCGIRENCGPVVAEAEALEDHYEKVVVAAGSSGERRELEEEYFKITEQQRLMRMIAEVQALPSLLVSEAAGSVLDRVKIFLKAKEELFATKLGRSIPLIVGVFGKCQGIVEADLVPALLTGGGLARVQLLLELFPESHPKHAEVMEQYVQLQMVAYEERLEKEALRFMSKREVVSVEGAIGLLNEIVNTLFVAQQNLGSELVGKLRDDLLCRASRQVLLAIELDSSIADVLVGADTVQSAVSAHLRIPLVSAVSIEIFTKEAIVKWIRSRFVSASRTCVAEDLPSLLAAGAYGACCDVIHTRCCTAVMAAHEFLNSLPELSSVDPNDFLPDVSSLVQEYYTWIIVPHTIGTVDAGEDQFHLLSGLVHVCKTLFHRRTVFRSLSSMEDIFGCSGPAPAAVVPGGLARLVKLLGVWTDADVAKLRRVIEQALVGVLEVGGAGSGGRFGGASEVLNEAEVVHSRKLMVFPDSAAETLPTLETGAFMVICSFLKTTRERVQSGEVQMGELADAGTVDQVKALAKKYIERGPDGTSELMQTVNAMIKDLAQRP